MIKEIFVSFELSKLLKEKGFNPLPICEDYIPCMYDENGKVHWGMYDPNWYWRITHQTALKWLREEHDLWCEIAIEGNRTWCVEAYSLIYEQFVPGSIIHRIKSYEKATEAIIKFCLENLNCHEDLIE